MVLNAWPFIDRTATLICSNKTENDLNQEVFDLAFEMFGIKNTGIKELSELEKTLFIPIKRIPKT